MTDLPPRLPAAAWTARDDLARLVAAFPLGSLRWVGGAVRDTLLGTDAKDIDAATSEPPDRVVDRLGAADIRCVPTGIAHGTVTAVLPGGPVEITTLRRDVATDGRHATVAFGTDWRADAARRDFTINALYADPATGAIDDWFGGLADLAAGRVRFIGDARRRIAEDHLRILRYFRFQARFGAAPDPEAEAACAALAPTLKGLSRERVAMELLALLALPDPAPTVAQMAALGVLAMVLPEADPAPLGALVAAERHAGIAPDPVRRLAALLPADCRVAQQVAARLRLSKAKSARLACAAARTAGDDTAPRALAYREGVPCACDRLLLTGGDPAPLADWAVPQLPLKGGEIVARGVGPGPAVARVLRAVEARWIAEGFPVRARVLELLEEELAGTSQAGENCAASGE